MIALHVLSFLESLFNHHHDNLAVIVSELLLVMSLVVG